MNYLTLNLTNADLVLSDNSSWKNLNTWLDGGTSYSDYYNASNCGDYWFADVHWINIDSTSAYLTFTIEYEFINAIATYSGLCQIKFDGFADGGVAVIADTTGLNVLTDSTSKHINCDYSNANIKIDITANLLTKEITTYIHKDQAPLAKVVSSSNYSFTKFLIQAGSRANSVYKLPTITKLLNVSVSDDAISYSNFSETRSFNYIDKHGLSEVWANIKNWVSAHIGNGTLTIQKNGTDVTTFSANSSSNATANITVPTKVSDLTNDSGFLTTANIPSKTSDLTNDSGFLTSHQSLSNYVTLDSTQTISGNKTFTGTLTGDITGNCSGSSGSCTGNAATATQFSANTTVALTGDATGTSTGSKKGWSVPVTLVNSGVTAGTYGPSADVTGNNNATISVPEITVDAKGRVTSVTNRTLTCKNNTYSVYNKTLTIQKNGTNVATFTSNSNTDVTANITVPTKVSELTNDSGFLTSHQSLSNYLTKTTNVSEMGRYIDMHYDNATSAYDYDVRLYVSAQGTAAGKGTFAVTAAATILNHKLTLLDFIYNKNSTLVKGTQPTSTLYTGIYLCDKNGTAYKNNALGLLENSVDKNNLVSTYIRAIKNEANSQVACEIAARVDASGNAYTYAPTPATADNSTKIATTAFVKAQGYLTSHQSLSNYSTLANTVKSLSISGKTITVTPGSGNAYTLTTQDTVYTHPTTAGNKHIPSGGSSGQILKYSASGTAVWADVSFTRQMEVVASDAPSGTAASGNYLPRDKSTTLTSSQLAVVTVDVTTSSPLMVKLTATNIFVIAIHTLVGTNGYKQDAVNYGSILQQTAAGRSRVVALILPYASSVKFTLAVQSGSGNITSYTLSVYQ